jgi:hypothetical protein
MKVKVKRSFTYQVDARTTATLSPGVHNLDKDLAGKVLRFGHAELVVEKKSPQNKKRDAAPENKKKVAKKAVRRSGTGTKSKS